MKNQMNDDGIIETKKNKGRTRPYFWWMWKYVCPVLSFKLGPQASRWDKRVGACCVGSSRRGNVRRYGAYCTLEVS
jgi:hypothetical protein